MKGHLWATLLGLGRTGAIIEIIIGFAFIIGGIILLFRSWYLIYTAQKKDELLTDGIYRFIRHPQYTGIFLALIGQLIHWPTILTLLIFPVIVVAYYHLARREEKVLTQRFGSEYEQYRKRVPMFFPRYHHLKSLESQI
jgi:protein-S-isoprenylcysteine O-methyltransferase Ste14